MNNRYLKIFVCVLMVCCLLFSFTFTAHATYPGQVGEFGGAIATIIAQSMGIDLDLRQMSIDSINEFLGILSDVNQKIWVIKQAAGMTALGLAKEGYDQLAQYIKNLVVDKNIQSNISVPTSIYTQSSYTWNGFTFRYTNNYGSSRWYTCGPLASGIFNGEDTFSMSSSGISFYATKSGNKYNRILSYNGNVISDATAGLTAGTNYAITYGFYEGDNHIDAFFYNAGYLTPLQNGVVDSVSPEVIVSSVSYTSGTIDTTIGDNLPATGGMIINFPNSLTGSIDEILGNLSDQVLSNETENITTEFVNDIGEPVVTDQTIADTPWTDLAGTLDQIKAYLQSTNISIQGHISSALDSIVDGVEAITEDVALGTSTTVKAYIDNFIELYLPWIQEIGNHGSIWHYVVSWIGSISSCFSWSLSALSSCGATFLAPIYAAFAGAVVIAIYRRFGR